MSTTSLAAAPLKVSQMAEHLIGSEIIKLANEINERIKKGEAVANLTIGDFDPKVFPIPALLLEEIINAYKAGHTNYPVANGMPELRQAVAGYISATQQLDYTADEILIAGGARPLIYGIYATLIDPGDKVVYPVPSWNNNHYCHLLQAKGVAVEATPENNFMPDAASLKPHLKGATLLALCSPQNPTGTIFTKQQLEEICDAVLEENANRSEGEKPLYIMYDQIYSALTYGDHQHFDPVSLRPELKQFTIYVDGLSKSFAATGIRVGWSMGPQRVIDKMKSILSHIGAWAPKAEQVASAAFLKNKAAMDAYMKEFKSEIEFRLHAFYDGIKKFRSEGISVDCIEPMAAIYLTVQFDLKGKRTEEGKVLERTEDVTEFILDKAKFAIVPFAAFGAATTSTWYRLSVGTCHRDKIPAMLETLGKALRSLK
jgi:aspartate aminotransferase